mgnify:CR=1 FL=1
MWLTFLAKLIGNFVRGEIKNIEGLIIEKVKKEVIEHIASGQSVTFQGLKETAIKEAKGIVLGEVSKVIDTILQEGEAKLSANPEAVAWINDARGKIKSLSGGQ